MTPREERQQLIMQIYHDIGFLRTKYRSYMPLEATRALDNLTKLCASLVEAVRRLEDQRYGRKAG